MTAKSILLFIATLSVSILNSTADPLGANDIPKSSEWYVHVNFDQISKGELADLIEELEFSILLETGKPTPLQYFTDENGEVSGGFTAYGDGNASNGVAKITGINSKDDLLASIKGADDYSTSNHRSYIVHSWTGKTNSPKGPKEVQAFAAFIDDSTVFASKSRQMLQTAIDYHDGDQAESLPVPNQSESAILAMFNLENLKGRSKISKMASSIDAQFDVAKNGSIEGEMVINALDRSSAKDIMTSIDGMLVLASFSADSKAWNPADGIKVKKSGTKVILKMDVPVSALRALRKFQQRF